LTGPAQLVSVPAEAAEFEHGVMCCYLYAAFSLKTEASEGLTPDQLQAVRDCKSGLIALAIPEMGHLALISNLLVSLGGSPNFGPQNFPVPPGYHPADIRIGLTPFHLDTVDHCIYLERPADSTLGDSTRIAGGVQYRRGGAFGRFFCKAASKRDQEFVTCPI